MTPRPYRTRIFIEAPGLFRAEVYFFGESEPWLGWGFSSNVAESRARQRHTNHSTQLFAHLHDDPIAFAEHFFGPLKSWQVNAIRALNKDLF